MASLVILPSKRKRDIQRYIFDFSNLLRPDETLSSADITVHVFSGADPNASEILRGALTYTDTEVSQDVQEGVEGVIYELYILVSTSLNRSLTIEARLAILPDNTQATPNRYPYPFTSRPYPVFSQSATAISAGMVGGDKTDILEFASSTEEASIGASFTGGVLRIVFKSGDTTNDMAISLTFPAGTVDTVWKPGDAGPTTASIRVMFGDGSGNSGTISTPNAIIARTQNSAAISASFIGGSLNVP